MALAFFNGMLYAGTLPHAQVYRRDRDHGGQRSARWTRLPPFSIVGHMPWASTAASCSAARCLARMSTRCRPAWPSRTIERSGSAGGMSRPSESEGRSPCTSTAVESPHGPMTTRPRRSILAAARHCGWVAARRRVSTASWRGSGSTMGARGRRDRRAGCAPGWSLTQRPPRRPSRIGGTPAGQSMTCPSSRFRCARRATLDPRRAFLTFEEDEARTRRSEGLKRRAELKNVRVGVVGVGSMGRVYADAIPSIDGLELAAVCNRTLAKIQDLPGEKFSNHRT